MKDFILACLILIILGFLWGTAKTVTQQKPEQKQKLSWEQEYKEKTAWLKPCKTEDSKYYHSLVMVCDKKKWKVGGVL